MRASICERASGLAASTLEGVYLVGAGLPAIGMGCAYWASDYFRNRTTSLNADGMTPRSLCLLGGVSVCYGLMQLAYIPGAYAGYRFGSYCFTKI